MENNQNQEQQTAQTQIPQGPSKICKHCKSVIPKGAKVCPVCRKKQGGIGKWIAAVAVIIIIIAAFGGGTSKNYSKTASSGSTTSSNKSTTTAPESKEAEPQVEYTTCTVDEMMGALKSNAMNASTTYKDQYVEITGTLSVIDASGKYISLVPSNDEYAILGVQCYMQDDAQKSKVAEMSIGDSVTLKGKVTDVGEVLGYGLDIDEIE